MPSLVVGGLQSIYRLTARKHRQLRQECEEIITAIQSEDQQQQQLIAAQSQSASPSPSHASSSSSSSSPPFITDTDADKYFLPFKLACESDSSRMVAAALNSIEKLIAYGYLDGASYADAEVYPVKKKEGEEKEKEAKERPPATPAAATEERKERDGRGSLTSPSPPSSLSSDSRRLISVIIDTVHHTSFNRDRDVQLQALKAILTAVTSVSCQVHGQPLVTATYSVWNVYLQAVDDIIKNTAKATLTQIFNLAFQRMESFAVQLRQLEQSAALSAAVAGEDVGKTGDKERKREKDREKEREKEREREREREKEPERKDEEKVDDSDTAAAAAAGELDKAVSAASSTVQPRGDDEEKSLSSSHYDAAEPSESAVSAASSSSSPPDEPAAPPPSSAPTAPVALLSPTARDPADAVVSPVSPSSSTSPPPAPSTSPDVPPARPAPGKRGYCVVCSKPANHYCLSTRDSVCSMECKLVNLQRRDRKSTIASDVQKKIQAKFSILQTDAYLLLRALIRISKKPLPSPHEASAVDSKLLSLELLLSIMRQPGPTFRQSQQFVSYVKVDVVDSILKNSDASIDSLFSLSSSIFVSLVRHFRAHLHKIIGPVLDSIYLPYISNSNSSFPIKQASLLVLKQICSEPPIIVELFLNYDCDIGSFNTFQKIATTLEKTVQGSFFNSGDGLTELEESRLKMLGLEALVDTMKSLVDWTKRGEEWELKLLQQAATAGAAAGGKKGEDGEEEAAGSSSRSSSPTSAASASRFGVKPGHTGAASSSPSTTSPPAEDDDPRSAVQHEDTYVAASSTSSSFSNQFHHLRQQKQKLDTGILRFNMKPKRGLQYLFEHRLLESTPEAVAAFFHANSALDKTAVGEFMGEDADFNKRVLYAYVDQMDFRGLAFDDGIRAFVSGFRLPGEAQKIDRMMEKFASQYHLHNAGMFNSADTAYVLAYSVILLNSDAHNPQVKNRMTKEEFFRNTRGIDDGKDINPAFLADIYDRITMNEIKMKDDAYRGLAPPKSQQDDGMTGQRRVNQFMKESQQMVKKTQDLIKAIGGGGKAGRTDSRRALEDAGDEQAASAAGRGVDGKAGGKDGKDRGEKAFYLALDSDWQACGAMFEILWYPSLATFSVLLEENESEQMIGLCLLGYRFAIRISNALNMETSRLAFVTSLKKFTLLGSSKEMRSKNIHAVKMLLEIVNTEGNFLKESWAEVLTCISEVERLHLIATSSKQGVDIFVGESQLRVGAAGALSSPAAPAPTQVASGKEKNREVDSANAGKLLIDVALIERVFINSANLNGDAIVDFASALRSVSEHELSSPQPRVFSLQKIVEITYYNMQRIRLVWSRVWAILSDFFIKAGCHANLGVSLYAIDSLRQLAMKFLEKDELTSFNYQKQFFRPFELVMAQNASVEARELIVQALSRMILARKNNIKSGWRAVFVVLAIAGQQQHQPLIQSSADLLSAIMEQHFPLITEIDTMDECINCLVAFGSQTVFTEISLQAIHYLTLCAAQLGAIPQTTDGSRSAASTPRRRGSSSASGAPLVNASTAPLTTVLATDTDLSASASSGGGGIAQHSADAHAASSQHYQSMSAPSTPNASLTALLSHNAVSQAHLLKVWFLLLTGLSRLVSDSRPEVRRLSLTTLFSILNEHGLVFAPSTWRAIFHGVLLPIFDDVTHRAEEQQAALRSPRSPRSPAARTLSHDSNGSAAAEAEESSWLRTTCYDALSSLILLFARFYPTTHFLLPELIRLLSGCISQESEELARIGVDCLSLLIREAATQWSVGSTWIVLEEIMELVKRTLPTPLLSPRVRQLLGLPPKPRAGEQAKDERKARGKGRDKAEAAEQERKSQPPVQPEEKKEGDDSAAAGQPQPPAVDAGGEPSPSPSSSGPDFSPEGETVRQRPFGSHSPSKASPLTFSTPLIHTRCRVQLLLLQALYDAVQRCFPRRDAAVTSLLSASSSQAKDASHFRRPSESLPDSTPPSSRGASAAAGEVRVNGAITAVSASASQQSDSQQASSTEADAASSDQSTQSAASRRQSGSASSSSAPPVSTARVSVVLPESRYHRRLDPRIFGHFLPSHLLYCLSIFSLTLSFSHDFNADIALRRRLYQAGFIIEQTGRLPQLFELEAKVTRFVWSSCFRLWKEGGTPAAAAPPHNAEHGWEDLNDIMPGREADVLSSPLASSLIAAPPSASVLASYQSAVTLAYNRLTLLSGRVLTSYLTRTQAGQLVSLQHVDDLVAAMVDGYASLRLELFACDLDVMVPLFGELAEWGSPQVRAAVRRWLQGNGLLMCQMAVQRRPAAVGQARKEDDEEGDSADEEEDEEDEEAAEQGKKDEEEAVQQEQPTAAAKDVDSNGVEAVSDSSQAREDAVLVDERAAQ